MIMLLDFIVILAVLFAPVLVMIAAGLPAEVVMLLAVLLVAVVFSRVAYALSALAVFWSRALSGRRDRQLGEIYSSLARAIRLSGPLAETFRALAADVRSPGARRQLRRVAAVAPDSVVAAVDAAPGYFPSTDRAMLAAGERAGLRVQALEQLARMRGGDVPTGVATPVFAGLGLILAMIGVLYILLTAVPRFKEIYDQLGAELPTVTQAIVALVWWVKSYAPFIVIALFGMVVLVVLKSGSVLAAILRLYPSLGVPYWSAPLARLTFTMGALIRAGESPSQAVGQAIRAGGTRLLHANSKAVHASVEAGGSLPDALSRIAGIPPGYLVHLQRADKQRMADDFMALSWIMQSDMSDARLGRWPIILPAVLLLIGLFYVALVFALYLPLFNVPKIIG
jgi:type IV pilus assembly protein PilC